MDSLRNQRPNPLFNEYKSGLEINGVADALSTERMTQSVCRGRLEQNCRIGR
jgi:hypothetical protein